ncbi:transcriptional regulator [Burkholderiales bacterium JOSHI_001]|nr:transcriptional regulator [Burkholderiales bacterium JOSHI_001]
MNESHLNKAQGESAAVSGTDEAASPKRTGVNALERGLRLLTVVNTPGGLTLSESARRAGLNKTTALRLFRSLERMAFVQRNRDRYSPGPAVAGLHVESAAATSQVLHHHGEGQRLSALTV